MPTARDLVLEARGLPNDRPGWGNDGWTRARYRRGLEAIAASAARYDRNHGTATTRDDLADDETDFLV